MVRTIKHAPSGIEQCCVGHIFMLDGQFFIDNPSKMLYNIVVIKIQEDRAMKKATKKIFKIIISIIYIIWGLWSPISALEAVLALNIPGLITAGVGVLMLLALHSRLTTT